MSKYLEDLNMRFEIDNLIQEIKKEINFKFKEQELELETNKRGTFIKIGVISSIYSLTDPRCDIKSTYRLKCLPSDFTLCVLPNESVYLYIPQDFLDNLRRIK